MSKKVIFISLPIAMIAIVISVLLVTTFYAEKLDVVEFHGNFMTYESEEALAQDADLIIVGQVETLLEQDEQFIERTEDSQNLVGFYSVSPFKVHSVLKGEYDEEYINIIQAAAIDKDNTGKKTKLVFEGYEELTKNDTYVLYLKKVTEEYVEMLGDNTYGILGVYYGKINLDQEVIFDSSDIHSQKLEEIRSEVIEKFEDVIDN